MIDGTGAAPRPDVSILVHEGRIAEIGAGISAPATRVLDAGGATVLPGLIDSHVHLSVIPGTVQRGDSPEATAELRRAHLRGYLAAGVTTVLDTGIDVATAREVHGWLAAGHPGPSLLTLGPPLPTPGGYMAQWASQTTVSSPAELDAAFDLIQGVGAVGVKVPIEKGFVQEIWPIHRDAGGHRPRSRRTRPSHLQCTRAARTSSASASRWERTPSCTSTSTACRPRGSSSISYSRAMPT